MAADQSNTVMGVSIDRQHRMQKKPATDPLADRPQAATPAIASLEVDLAGVPGLRRGRLWMPRIWRPATAPAVPSPHPVTIRSTVTFGLRSSRPKRRSTSSFP
jgi:hypothetical protein